MRLFLALMLLFATPLRAEDVTVFAAASLKTALDRAAGDWTGETGIRVTLSYAGTPVLARQITQGAPADLFLSANGEWMDFVQEQGLIQAETRVDLLGNTLVLVGPKDAAPVLLPDLPQGRIAMALVDAVPAGIYGKAALTGLGLWDGIAARVVQTDNVRAALALVALGEAPLGVVYASDAMAEPRVTVLATFPPGSHPPIAYPAALTLRAGQAARDFLAWLQTPPAQAIFAEQGFRTMAD